MTVDPALKDALGICRPVIRYDVSDYTRAAMAAARDVSKVIFARLGIPPADDHTLYQPSDPGYLTYGGVGYTYRGAGHLVGTHRMGNSPATSVVNTRQQCWDHENLPGRLREHADTRHLEPDSHRGRSGVPGGPAILHDLA